MNITEDYVSFEIAKLLKEKGYNLESFASIKVFREHRYEVNGEWITPKEDTIIPTLQMAMKWLRKKHNVHIEPRYFPMPNIYRYVIIHSPVTIENINSHPQYFDTYEQACEAAIEYCLTNLI